MSPRPFQPALMLEFDAAFAILVLAPDDFFSAREVVPLPHHLCALKYHGRSQLYVGEFRRTGSIAI